MKKSLLIFLFSISFYTFSQNWNLLDQNKTYFFKHVDSTYITNTIAIDSVDIIGSDTSYHVATTLRVCDTCTVIPLDALNGIMYHAHWPELFGSNPNYSNSTNEFTFQNGTIKHHAEISDSWIFDSGLAINAIVSDKYEATFLGQTDSIKTIVLSTNDTILISKNHGVIRYPDFENSGKYFLQVGYHEGQNSFGEYYPNVWRIYDFNVGDEFCYKLRNENAGSWEMITRDFKFKILENLSTGTEISYKVKVYYSQVAEYGSFEEPIYYYYSTNYIDTFSLLSSEAYFENKFTGISNCPSDNLYDFDNTFYSEPFISSEILSEYYNVGIIFTGLIHNYTPENGYQKKYYTLYFNSDSLAYLDEYEVYPGIVSYTKGLGRDSLDFYDFEIGGYNFLVGYIKNGDTNGTVYNFPEDLSIDETLNQDVLKFYPNPSNNIIFIPSGLQTISIFNNAGEKVLNVENPEETISVNYLPHGIYFVKAIDAEGKIMTCKLIIQ